MAILGLDHVQLAMPAGGEAAARPFYENLLGLKEMPKPEPLQGRGGCWFAGNGVQIHLGVTPDFAPARKAHPAFVVSDLEALRHKLLAADVEVVADTAVPHVHRFYAHDPFGNRLEFIQNGDGFNQ